MANDKKQENPPSQAYHPILSARIPYKLKLKIEEDAYTRQFALQQYTRMLLQKAYEECGGIEGMNALLEQSKKEGETQKQLEDLQKALEKEQGQRQEAEKKADRLQKEKQTEANKAKGEGTEKGKLKDQVKKLQGELKELKGQLEKEQKKRKELEGRLQKANKWCKEANDAVFGKDPPKNGW